MRRPPSVRYSHPQTPPAIAPNRVADNTRDRSSTASSLSTNPWYFPANEPTNSVPLPSHPLLTRPHYPGGPVGTGIVTATPSHVSPEGLSTASDPIGMTAIVF